MIGTAVGHYRVIARLSAGGMGVVYRAEHELLGKPAAIKVLHPELTTNRDIVDRFFTEAKATTSIRHVGIVEVFDSGLLPNGQAFIAMELLEGLSLGELLERERSLPPQLAAEICLQVLAALDAAHVVGVIHRDLKPDNIQLVHDASSPARLRAKILDFGIAKLLLGDEGKRAATRGGMLLGTPSYMSPEQCRGELVDARSDLYAAGCILFEMLTGEPPFDGETSQDIVSKHLREPPPRLRAINAALPPELDQLIARMLAKELERRAPSAAWSLAHLERVQLDSLAQVRQMIPTPTPRRAASIGLPAAALAVVLPAPIPMPSPGWSGRIPDSRTPVMSDSGNWQSVGEGRAGESGQMAEESSAWRRRMPWVVVGIALLIALAAVLAIGIFGSELPAPPAR